MLKQGDFVELEYVGKIKESGEVFDTTSKDVAEKEGIMDEHSVYGPAVISLGAHQLLKGLEDQLIGKEPGKDYTIELSVEQAFGKKDGKLLKLISTAKFRKQGIQAQPGLRINIDGMVGTIKTVTGGRTIVDFNHILSGKEITYEVKVIKVIKNTQDQIKGLLKVELMQENAKVTVTEKKVEIELQMEIPVEYLDKFKEKTLELVPTISDIIFTTNLNTKKD